MKRESGKNRESCPRRQIVAFIDGELSPQEEAEFERHMRDCRGYSEELNELRDLGVEIPQRVNRAEAVRKTIQRHIQVQNSYNWF